jgi:hypothetical protein
MVASDSPPPPPPPPAGEAGTAPPPGPPRRRRRWGLIAFLILIVIPITGFALYTWGALTFVYSRGERVGYVQKISKRGWLCKTWEGEIAMATMPGVAPQIWDFTVRSDSIARLLGAGGVGTRMALTYEQHKGLPTSCFGETEYFVVGVHPIEQP